MSIAAQLQNLLRIVFPFDSTLPYSTCYYLQGYRESWKSAQPRSRWPWLCTGLGNQILGTFHFFAAILISFRFWESGHLKSLGDTPDPGKTLFFFFFFLKAGKRHMTRCCLNFKKRVPPAKKLIPRAILTVNSPKSPGMDFTHPKSRFEIFWDPTQPPSWSKLTMCAKSG